MAGSSCALAVVEGGVRNIDMSIWRTVDMYAGCTESSDRSRLRYSRTKLSLRAIQLQSIMACTSPLQL